MPVFDEDADPVACLWEIDGEELRPLRTFGEGHQGHLSGACLDVFREEPLPESHPFWRHPRITVTPHISSLTYPAAVAPQLVENYRRLESGRPLENVVDPERGY